MENIFFREIDLYLTQKDYEDVGKKDFSVEYYPEPYCAIFNSLDDVCFEDSIFELFGKHGIVDVDFIESLSVENILHVINGPQKSGIFSGTYYYTLFKKFHLSRPKKYLESNFMQIIISENGHIPQFRENLFYEIFFWPGGLDFFSALLCFLKNLFFS